MATNNAKKSKRFIVQGTVKENFNVSWSDVDWALLFCVGFLGAIVLQFFYPDNILWKETQFSPGKELIPASLLIGTGLNLIYYLLKKFLKKRKT